MCISCRDSNTPVSKTFKLKCLHRMCHSCLRKRFKLSLTDPHHHMPPRCCTEDNIPPELVDMLLEPSFKKEWNEKFMEYTGRTRLICPSRRCAEPLKPENMRREGGRWQGRCGNCRTKVCGSCSGRWHPEPECPRPDEPRHFLEQAKREPWQRCYRCKTMVEIKDGRNHMIWSEARLSNLPQLPPSCLTHPDLPLLTPILLATVVAVVNFACCVDKSGRRANALGSRTTPSRPPQPTLARIPL